MSEHSHCDHDHSHSHDHSHGHHHHHAPKNYNSIFLIGVVFNFAFVLVEATYGFIANSLALVADAGHNFSDVIGLLLAWGAFWLTKKRPSQRFTYGLRKSSILSALLNAVILLLAIGAIIWEAIHRFWSPQPLQSTAMIAVASIGIVINTATALLFMKDRHHDINIKGAFLHMAADALISLGVVAAGIVIHYTHWNWLDPVMSLTISLIIIVGTWGLLKDSVQLSMDAVPNNIDPTQVKKYLAQLTEVVEVHDLHIWAISTTETALSAHLVVKNQSASNSNQLLKQISQELKSQFHIHHPTVQIEYLEEGFNCELKPDEVV